MKPKILEYNWKVIQEFPRYEINVHGNIRETLTHYEKGTYVDGYGNLVVQFTKEGKRYLRSVEKLKRVAFSALG